MEKTLWPVFSPFIEHENIGEQHFIRVYKVFRQFLCKRFHHFFWTLEVDRNKHFKKQLFQVTKHLAQFPRIIEHDKCLEIFLKGHKLFWFLLWNL